MSFDKMAFIADSAIPMLVLTTLCACWRSDEFQILNPNPNLAFPTSNVDMVEKTSVKYLLYFS